MKPLGLLLLFTAGGVLHAEIRREMLVQPAELAAKLEDKTWVVLHVGGEKDYNEGHIPGANLLKLADISREGEGGLRIEMPDAAEVTKAFLRAGVTDDVKRIVLYGMGMPSVTRTWFTLDYLGLGERASILDGGLHGWKAEGRLVSQDPPPGPLEGGRLSVHPKPELIVDAAWLAGRLQNGGVRVVDARLPEFYKGEQPGQGMPRAGHIPGATNVPYTSLFDDKQRFLNPEDLAQKIGGPTAPVVYCHIGMQATVAYFVASYLGMSPRLYDASWQDWSRRPELPIAAGEAK